MTYVNEEKSYGVASMFNFALEDTPSDINQSVDEEDIDE